MLPLAMLCQYEDHRAVQLICAIRLTSGYVTIAIHDCDEWVWEVVEVTFVTILSEHTLRWKCPIGGAPFDGSCTAFPHGSEQMFSNQSGGIPDKIRICQKLPMKPYRIRCRRFTSKFGFARNAQVGYCANRSVDHSGYVRFLHGKVLHTLHS